MTKQDKIIYEIAHKHGIPEAQAKEIFELHCNAIKGIISDPSTKENGKFIIDNFKSFSIGMFGKFVPKKRQIDFLNKLFEERENECKP